MIAEFYLKVGIIHDLECPIVKKIETETEDMPLKMSCNSKLTEQQAIASRALLTAIKDYVIAFEGSD